MQKMRYYSAGGIGVLTLHESEAPDPNQIMWAGFFGGDLAGKNAQLVAIPEPETNGRFAVSRLLYAPAQEHVWPTPSTGLQPAGQARFRITDLTLEVEITLDRTVMGVSPDMLFSPPPPGPNFTRTLTLNRML